MVKYEPDVCDFTGILKLRCGHCRTLPRVADTPPPDAMAMVEEELAANPIEPMPETVEQVETVEVAPVEEPMPAPRPLKRKATE